MTYYSYDGQASDSLQGALVVLHLSRVGYIWGLGTELTLGCELGTWRCRVFAIIGCFADMSLLWKPETLKRKSCLFSDIAVTHLFIDSFIPQTTVALLSVGDRHGALYVKYICVLGNPGWFMVISGEKPWMRVRRRNLFTG